MEKVLEARNRLKWGQNSLHEETEDIKEQQESTDGQTITLTTKLCELEKYMKEEICNYIWRRYVIDLKNCQLRSEVGRSGKWTQMQ